MKRLILLLICALYVTTAAQAQISFYGEWCRKGSGEKTIMIFDMKEKKAYVMNEARKTCMVMEEIQLAGGLRLGSVSLYLPRVFGHGGDRR